MNLLVVDLNEDVVTAVRKLGIEAMCAPIHHVEGVFVSPANSFGFMDGGIDAVYARMFPGVQDIVRQTIWEYYAGELPVGNAFYMDLVEYNHPGLIVAPTMRTPATNVSNTLNAYLACRAAIRCYSDLPWGFQRVTPLIMPGMGTASGRMAPTQFAKQLKQAMQEPVQFSSWREAKQAENEML